MMKSSLRMLMVVGLGCGLFWSSACETVFAGPPMAMSGTWAVWRARTPGAVYVARVPHAVRKAARYQRHHTPAVVVVPVAPTIVMTGPAQVVGWSSPKGYFYRASYQSAVMPRLPGMVGESAGPSPEVVFPSESPEATGLPEVIATPRAEP